MTKNLNRDYIEAGFSHQLGFGSRPALLMVDFIQAYFIESSPFYAKPESVATVAGKVLAAARENKVPVIFTRVIYDENGINGGMFVRKIGTLRSLVEGSPYVEIASNLAPRPNELVVTKQYASAFFGTTLMSTLTALNIDNVLICGLTTSGCVRASAVDAIQFGYIPTVIADAVGDRDVRPHRANLFDLSMKYADVIKSPKAIKYLQTVNATRLRQ